MWLHAVYYLASALIWPDALAAQSGPAPMERHLVVVEPGGLRVALWHQPARGAPAEIVRPPVLFIHGATFPTQLAAGFRFGGRSWMEDLAGHGFDVWGLDFLGYGGSDRYPEMGEPAADHPPLGRASEASRQIDAAVRFIRERTRKERVSLVAHSWGTVPAGLFTTRHAELVDRLVLFGPVSEHPEPRVTAPFPGWSLVTIEEQRARFLGYVPAGEAPVLDGLTSQRGDLPTSRAMPEVSDRSP